MVNEFLSRRVDGLIMSPIESQDYRRWIGSIRAADLPFVSLIRLLDHVADTVVAADRCGARKMDELLAAGIRFDAGKFEDLTEAYDKFFSPLARKYYEEDGGTIKSSGMAEAFKAADPENRFGISITKDLLDNGMSDMTGIANSVGVYPRR